MHCSYYPAQGQTNDKDCGVFAVAFAMALCNEMVPEELTFYQERMRGHLQFCLEDKLMRHFPSKHRNCSVKTLKTEIVPVFCKCRRQEKGEMIECAKCEEWYHKTCTTVPDGAWSDDEFEWSCDDCSP